MTTSAVWRSGANKLKVGLVVGLDATSGIEDLPIDSLWAGGHVASPNPTPEALVGLARLSAVTTRVTIGTSILLLPLYQPAIVAKQIADLDRYTGGRVVLGVGVGGEYPAEFRACGVPLGERGRRADEMIPLLRRLWSGDVITHEGPYYPMADVRIHPVPAQADGPPIVVAGRKAPAMRRAARLGDGWMPYLYSPRRYAASLETIVSIALAYQRNLSDFEWFAFIFVNVVSDAQRARDQAVAALGGTYSQDFRAMVEHVAAVGTPEEVRRTIQAFVDAGARHLVFAPRRHNDVPRVIRDLLSDVVPGIVVPDQHPAREPGIG